MPSHQELVRSLYDAFARGDAGAVLGAMHPEVDWNEAEGSPYADQNPYTGTRKGSGQPLDAPFAHVWTVEDGRVTAFQQYTDTAQYQRLMATA